MKYEKLTYEIINSAMEVHRNLGNGFREVYYQRAMIIDLKEKGYRCSTEVSIPVYYKDHKIGRQRVDLLVDDTLMVELKAIPKIYDTHLGQAFNYLSLFNLDIGLLINFGARKLEFKRVYNKNYNKAD